MSEGEVQNYYKLDSLYPEAWPDHNDPEESSEDESLVPEPQRARITSRSRFSALGSKRTSVPGAERTKDGFENLVQRDEPDPLGSNNSVITALKRKGVSIDADSKLSMKSGRCGCKLTVLGNRYLLSSTTFSAPMFLSQVHSDASTQDLVEGLNHLSREIEQKSISLKVLVESNFEKFVRAKSTIDNVYKEMVTAGGEPETQAGRKGHSRQTSRQSGMHFRKVSGQQSGVSMDKRKNALVKEQDYGVLPIKVPLLELKNKVNEVWGPAIGGRDREDSLKVMLTSVEKQRNMFDVGTSIAESIKRKEYDLLVEEYVKAKRLSEETRRTISSTPKESLTDEDVVQAIITARMWSDVENQVENFKRDIWRRLAGTHLSRHMPQDDKPEEYVELISILLELGVDENPISVCLFSRYDYLKQKIVGTFERSRLEIEILRRRLSYGEEPTPGQVASYLRDASADGNVQPDTLIDSAKVVELWEHVYSCLNGLLSTNGGILGEVIEYWETAESFIAGRAQKDLPVGIDGASRQHHRLSMDEVKALDGGAQELISLIRENISSFFTESPIEDLSPLLSPSPQTPITPNTPKTPKTTTIQTFSDARLKVDIANIPPPSPVKGKSWEKFAFWPPYATALSGVYYLSKILHLIGTAACDMAGLRINGDGRVSLDTYKLLVGSVRERCAQSACAAWNEDCEMAGVLEDWTRSLDRPDQTKFPTRLMNFESFMLHHLQKIMYVSETNKRPTSPDIIVPPSSKLLLTLRSHFLNGLLKMINTMKDTAENAPATSGNLDGLVTPMRDPKSGTESSGPVDSLNKNVRLLLTLSNVQGIRADVIGQLIGLFESSFTVKLTDEAATISDALHQLDAKLFQAYVNPMINKTDALVKSSISSQDWTPKTTRPTDARPYVYDVLLGLVLVHTEVSTTASPLTATILKHLLEKHLVSLLEAFKQRSRYSLPALMQATLDVEFMAQTLSNYTTEVAGKTQSDIYVLLDARTDDDARVRLQRELQELRSILKRLREGTRTEL
jgi:exocyst complex component 2